MTLSVEDRLGIQELLTSYSHGLDFGLEGKFLSCFSPTGRLLITGIGTAGNVGDVSFTGPDKLAGFLDDLHRGLLGHSRHWVLPVEIQSTGEDEASVTAYCQVLRPGEFPGAGITLTGMYYDKVEKLDGRWVFRQREFRADPQPQHASATPTDSLVARFDAALQSGERTSR
ncbi:nuclear transport factor 2 family protein [Arthrobacter sp. KNU-44]|uniref:nuclear transport factor 2 family protein n=1 Tax=Arthrobacter sp. KNU-44 TaxID=3450744 RepID=UPI003F43098F